jgi:hypothetical protein
VLVVGGELAGHLLALQVVPAALQAPRVHAVGDDGFSERLQKDEERLSRAVYGDVRPVYRKPRVPYSMYSRCLECSGNYLQCKQVASQLPTHHKHVFDYLTAFLREVILHSAQNGIDPKILATLFCSLFLRDPPGTNLGSGLRAKTNQQLLERRKAAFIYHFIVNEPDD